MAERGRPTPRLESGETVRPEQRVSIDQIDTAPLGPARPTPRLGVDPAELPTQVQQAMSNFSSVSAAQTVEATRGAPISPTSPGAPVPAEVQRAIADRVAARDARPRPAIRWRRLGVRVAGHVVHAVLASAILVGAALVRWWNLGVPGLSAAEITLVSATAQVSRIAVSGPISVRSAAYLFLLRWWMSAVGSSDLAVRELSAICGVLTVGVVYVLARRIAGPRAAVIASALLAVAPLHVAYSQQVSRYALLTLLSAVLALLTLMLLDKPRSLFRWGAWIACALLLVSVALSGLILVIALGVMCALKLRYSVWKVAGLSAALAGIVILLALQTFLAWSDIPGALAAGPQPDSSGLIVNTLIAYGAWSADTALPGILAVPFVLLMALGVVLLVRARREMEAGILLAWLLGTPVVLFLISFVTPMYDLSLVVSSLPAYTILAAAGIIECSRALRGELRRMRWMRGRRHLRRVVLWVTTNLVLLVVAGGVVAANARLDMRYFTTHQGAPWRVVAGDVAHSQQAGDVILMADAAGETQPAFDYYYLGDGSPGPALPRLSLPPQLLAATGARDSTADAQRVLSISGLVGAHHRVWVLVRTDGNRALQGELFAAMPARFTPVQQRTYTGESVSVQLSLWTESTSISKGN